MRLFHFSEDPAITHFDPRPPKSSHRTIRESVVWAVGEPGMWAYYVPRQCPRVLFWAESTSSPDDIDTFLGGDVERKVLVIESTWFERCCTTTLYRYEFKAEHFSLYDAPANYYLSRQTEHPLERVTIQHPLHALLDMRVEVRFVPELWDVREKAFRSTLGWSFIRMVNATVPKRGYEAYLPV